VRRRFFVEKFEDERAVMGGEAAHHLGHVLRAQQGQLYELSDGSRVRLGRIERVGRDRIEFSLLEEVPADQPNIETILLLSIVKFDAFEWALEKATELGVSTIIPLAASRSENALVAAAKKRAARWSKILLESSQQSRRLSVPTLEALEQPAKAFATLGTREITKLMLSERQNARPLRQVLADLRRPQIALVVGPEGGWTEEELEAAGKAGFREASLGKLILRTGTAVIAALAVLNYALEPGE
jgi:16S rRNA (uracil1498-N3)-methyltransferase